MEVAGYEWLINFRRIMTENADPRSKGWAFVDSPLPLVMACLSYLYFVCHAGPRYMENKKPYGLTKIITIYNLFQIAACSAIIYGMSTTFPVTQFGCKAVNISDPASSCRIASLNYWTMMLKVTELAETVFFVLRKKQNQISKLHLYHHVSTLTVAWITTKFHPGEVTVIPIILNSFIHVLMYSYYLIALHAGKAVQKLIIWKKSLTILQMVQFIIIIGHILSILQSNCPVPKFLLLLMFVNIIINFVLFYRFYKRTYKKTV